MPELPALKGGGFCPVGQFRCADSVTDVTTAGSGIRPLRRTDPVSIRVVCGTLFVSLSVDLLPVKAQLAPARRRSR